MRLTDKSSEWQKTVLECQSSGMTSRQYCEDHGINIHTYYYWMKRLRGMACSIPEKKLIPQVNQPQAIVQLTFLEEERCIPTSDSFSTAVILHLNSITMEIRNGASESIIRNQGRRSSAQQTKRPPGGTDQRPACTGSGLLSC